VGDDERSSAEQLGPEQLALVVRRKIRAPLERVFEAWTTPAQLMRWWGPRGVRCIAAEVDLRVGGSYRIGNQLPDESVIWIAGEFAVVAPPRELVYSWQVTPGPPGRERVTVRFEPREPGATEIVIVHERIESAAMRAGHEKGWEGCLDGLSTFCA
jgi:uncharacterized protein YndB with AHSA1/START domain